MKRIIVSSKDEVKLDAVLGAFQKIFPQEQFFVEGVLFDSKDKTLPKSSIETYSKAWTGMYTASTEYPTADFYVGIESGIEERNSDIASFTWCTILGKDGTFGKCRSSLLFLPSFFQTYFQEDTTVDLIIQDKRAQLETPLTQESGIVGLFTGNNITQQGCIMESTMLALSPFKYKRAFNPIVISFLGSMVNTTDDSNLYRNIIHILKKYGVVKTEQDKHTNTVDANSTMFQDTQPPQEESVEDADIVKGVEEGEKLPTSVEVKPSTQPHVVVVEATMLDFNTGYQLGILGDKKPILCLCQAHMDDAHIHPICKNTAHIHIRKYTSLTDIESIVQSFLDEHC